MKTRSSASPRRTVNHRNDSRGWLSAVVAVSLASLPIGVMLLVFPSGFA